MSNIVITVNASSAGDGFLIAPDNGINFSVPLNLSTNDHTTVMATIDATPNGAGVALPPGIISIGPAGTVISIFATAASAARGDTVINVHVGAVTTSFSLTAISNPEIWFSGRFEARFATDNDWYNDPKGTWGAGNDGINALGNGSSPLLGGPGYTFWLEGEPEFTPTGKDAHGVPLNVPTTIDKTGVGRVVRFNNPVALRSHAAPVATAVAGIRGALSTSAPEYFTAGDPVIGAAVNLGPDTYLAQNWQANLPTDPPPKETTGGATTEHMACFEFHIEGFFSGQPSYTGKPGTTDDRPQSTGFNPMSDDPNSPIPTTTGVLDFTTFTTARQTALQHDYDHVLTASDRPTLSASGVPMAGTGSVAGRNLVRRLQALASATGTLPSFGTTGGRPGSDSTAWGFQEEYENGQVNTSITFQPNSSSVMDFFEGYTAFAYYNKFHTFHSDELDATVYGSLKVNPSARLAKTCALQIQNSTFGQDELKSMGLPANFPTTFWVVLEGFFPSELGIDATDHLTSPANPPAVTFSVDPTNANQAAIINFLQTMGQLQIQPFSGPVFTTTVPPPNTPQRILYPFNIQFTGTGGFIDQTENLTLTANITVNGKPYTASAPLVLTKAANPYVTDSDAGNNYTSWLSTDLRVFSVDDDKKFFDKKVSDFYPPGTSNPPTPAQASAAATAYIADLIKRITPSGAAGTDSFDNSLTEAEDATGDELEYLTINPRTKKPAYNFAICRVRIQGTTPVPLIPPPFTTQAQNCRVFFRAFQAQNTVSTFDTSTTYRSTPIGTPDVTPRVPLLGIQTDAMGQDEVVTIPFFAVERWNFAGPADLTKQPPDTPNVQTISPTTGKEVDTYYGCWLDMNQPTPLFPQFVKATDFDNQTGYFNTTGFTIQSINAAFSRAPHQCLIAEIAFDDIPIPPNADSSTSDKLAQRNLAYIDGPNPGAPGSRRMPHPFQIKASSGTTHHLDELMITWGNTPAGSSASIYLPGVTAAEILALADSLYSYHTLSIQDQNTITTPTGPVTFVPIPLNTGFLAGLLTVDLPAGIKDGDLYTIVVRQLTDATQVLRGQLNDAGQNVTAAGLPSRKRRKGFKILTWRRVLGAFQINLRIHTKQELLVPEERRLALFRWIAENVLPQSRWYPVMQRYIEQLAIRVLHYGGNPIDILPSPTGAIPGDVSGPGEVCVVEHHKDHGEQHEVTGKVNGLVFDHFGDFEGFILETRLGELERFHSREKRVLEIVGNALEERSWLTVHREPKRHDQVRTIILRVPPPRDV
ncbi:MAG TPA: hypothetical protein VGP62_02660 [Bryobacteraceae bacterium]|jgi:hypothetical protein|nr:hypothetical protein [Bryobacteraceae bacterium]